MEVKAISKKNIVAFAESRFFEARPDTLIPITLQRARSYEACPLAEDYDTVLFAAYEGKEMAGYLGFLPGLLKADGKTYKMRWLSALFALPQYPGTGGRLLQAAIESGFDLAATGVTQAASHALTRSGFEEGGHLNCTELELGPLRRMLWKFVFRGITDQIQLEEIDAFGEKEFKERDGIFFERPVSVLNWMKRYPWIIESAAAPEPPAYYFSDTRPVYKMHFAHLPSLHGKGGLVFSVSKSRSRKKKVLKFLDCESKRLTPSVFIKTALGNGADILQFESGLCPAFENHPAVSLFTRRYKRPYFFRPSAPDSPLARYSEKVWLSYGDGDSAFT